MDLKPVSRSILFCAVFTTLFMAFAFVKTIFPVLPERWMHTILGTIAALLTTMRFLRWQKRRWSDIGLQPNGHTLVRFFTGMALGLLVMGILAFDVMRIAAVEIVPNPERESIWITLGPVLVLLVIAVTWISVYACRAKDAARLQ